MPVAYIGLGSNIGDKAANLKRALEALENIPGISVRIVSSLYRTEPVGEIEQDWFLNAAAEIETALSPRELLNKLLNIEKELGRVREVRWGPRVIDLDILMYDDLVVNEEGLVIPHPYMHERGFVLIPLAEIAPDAVHPLLKKRITEMVSVVKDNKTIINTGGLIR